MRTILARLEETIEVEVRCDGCVVASCESERE